MEEPDIASSSFLGDFPGRSMEVSRAIETSNPSVLNRVTAMSHNTGSWPEQAQALVGAILDGRFPENPEVAEEVLKAALASSAEDDQSAAMILVCLGRLAHQRHDLKTAADRFSEALIRYGQIGDRIGEATAHHELGRLSLQRDDLGSAAAHLSSSLALFRGLEHGLGEAAVLLELGALARQRNNHDEAAAHLGAAVTLFQQIGHRLGEANTLLELGKLAMERYESSHALGHFIQALEAYREIGERRGQAVTLVELASLAELRGDLDEAAASLAVALTLFRAIGDRRSQGRVLLELGSLDLRNDDPDQAESNLEEALALCREVGEQLGEVAVLGQLAALHRRREDLDRAETYLGEALALSREVGGRQSEGSLLMECALLAGRRHDLDGADAYFNAALAKFREVGDRLGEANCIYKLGDHALQRHDLNSAGVYLTDALTVSQEIGYRLGEANALGDLGWLALRRGDLDVAAVQLEEALALHREIGDRTGESGVFHNLGLLGIIRGDHDNAVVHLESALALCREIGYRAGEASTLRDLGMLDRRRGLHNDSAAYLNRAMGIYREIGDFFGEATVLFELGTLDRLRDHLGNAVVNLSKALTLYREAGDRLGESNALRELGATELQRNELDAAAVHLNAALALSREISYPLGEANALVQLGALALTRASLSETNDNHRQSRGALGLILEAVRGFESMRSAQGSAQTRAGFYRNVRPVYLNALKLAAALKDGRAALEITEAARADGVAAVLRQGPLEASGEIGEVLARIRLLEATSAEHERPAAGLLGLVGTIASGREATSSAQRRTVSDTLEALYQRLGELTSGVFAAAYAPAPATGDPDTARGGLPRGVHALLYELDDTDPGNTVAFCTWLAPDGEPQITTTVLEPQARAVLARYAGRDETVVHEADPLPYEQLAAALLPPQLRAELAETSGTDPPLEMLVIPAGALWALPWAALRLHDGRPLIEAAAITLVPSLGVEAALATRQPTSGASGVLVCVGTDPDISFWAEHPEVVTLRNLYNDALEIVEPAGLVLRLRASPARDHTVITGVHGQAPEAAAVGLDHHIDLGAGVRLRAGDLLGAALGGTLTVGACFIASPIARPGDEPLSLPTLALCAGAQTVVAGIFAIPNELSTVLLSRYYEALATGWPPHRALREAQRAYLADHPAWPPANWAGLTATGGHNGVS